jgi:asparagine synthetase B (glutamine-hydrolysing)
VGLLERINTYDNAGKAAGNANIAASHKNSLDGGNLTAALERYERVASYYGVEARHPLLDKRLVEFCVRLPWRLKTRDGWTKYLLRRLASELLPRQVAWREGVGINLSWYFNAELLREFASNGNFDPAAITQRTAVYVEAGLTFESKGVTMSTVNIENAFRWWELCSLGRFLQRSGIKQ